MKMNKKNQAFVSIETEKIYNRIKIRSLIHGTEESQFQWKQINKEVVFPENEYENRFHVHGKEEDQLTLPFQKIKIRSLVH